MASTTLDSTYSQLDQWDDTAAVWLKVTYQGWPCHPGAGGTLQPTNNANPKMAVS